MKLFMKAYSVVPSTFPLYVSFLPPPQDFCQSLPHTSLQEAMTAPAGHLAGLPMPSVAMHEAKPTDP